MNKNVVSYLKERKISEKVINEFWWLHFIFNTTNKSYQMALRDLQWNSHWSITRYIDWSTPKEKCNVGSKPSLWLLYKKLPNRNITKYILVCEWSIDFLSAHTTWWDNEEVFIVWLIWSWRLADHLWLLQHKCDKILICLDDSKDIDTMLQKVIDLDITIVWLGGILDCRTILKSNECKDLNELLEKGIHVTFDTLLEHTHSLKHLVEQGIISPSPKA